MSGAPTGKQQSERELKTARTLNTVATIGAGHALYAMTPEKHRLKIREGMLKIAPKKVRPKVESGLNALKQPEIGGKLGTAGKVVAGGWLALHGGELAGDIMARRSINNQLEQAQKNKGKVNTVKNNDQSMISKADGSVSGNGNGKAIDATGIIAVPSGAALIYQGSKLNTKAKRATASANKYTESAATNKIKQKSSMKIAQKKLDRGFVPGVTPAGFVTDPETLKWSVRGYNHGVQATRDTAKAKKMSDIARQLKSSRNKYVAGGTALIGGTGIERAYNAKKVEKDYVSKGIPSVAKPLLDRGGRYTTKVGEANYPRIGTKAPFGGQNGFMRAAISSSGKQASRIKGTDTDYFRTLVNTGKKDKEDYKRFLAQRKPTGSFAAIGKAYRRFDPEADRQRRIGQASVAGPALGYLLAERASRNFTTDVGRTAQGKKIRGIAVKPGRGKAGTLLALGSAAATGTGVAAYRHGLSVRNQPWT